jgi:uncharacterized protein YbjT (DUF2867 family)
LQHSTGGTGYIGGTVLDSIVKTHPEYEVTVLLRNPPANFSDRYPNVHVVRGDYNSADLITEVVSKVDIVVRKFIIFPAPSWSDSQAQWCR